jgi:hypothetical protein
MALVRRGTKIKGFIKRRHRHNERRKMKDKKRKMM